MEGPVHSHLQTLNIHGRTHINLQGLNMGCPHIPKCSLASRCAQFHFLCANNCLDYAPLNRRMGLLNNEEEEANKALNGTFRYFKSKIFPIFRRRDWKEDYYYFGNHYYSHMDKKYVNCWRDDEFKFYFKIIFKETFISYDDFIHRRKEFVDDETLFIPIKDAIHWSSRQNTDVDPTFDGEKNIYYEKYLEENSKTIMIDFSRKRENLINPDFDEKMNKFLALTGRKMEIIEVNSLEDFSFTVHNLKMPGELEKETSFQESFNGYITYLFLNEMMVFNTLIFEKYLIQIALHQETLKQGNFFNLRTIEEFLNNLLLNHGSIDRANTNYFSYSPYSDPTHKITFEIVDAIFNFDRRFQVHLIDTLKLYSEQFKDLKGLIKQRNDYAPLYNLIQEFPHVNNIFLRAMKMNEVCVIWYVYQNHRFGAKRDMHNNIREKLLESFCDWSEMVLQTFQNHGSESQTILEWKQQDFLYSLISYSLDKFFAMKHFSEGGEPGILFNEWI